MKTASTKKYLRTTVTDNHGNEYKAYLKSDDRYGGGVVLHIDGTPGHWYLSTLLDGSTDDAIYIDLGQGWYVTGMRKLLKEAEKSVRQEYVIASELVKVAKLLTGATDNLDDILEIMPAMQEKMEEYDRKQQEMQREMNQMYNDAVKDVRTKVAELSQTLGKALVDYFKKNGMGVRRADIGDSLVEIFIGSDDGIKRVQSKVSTHISFQRGNVRATYMLRNENLDDISSNLSPKNTVRKLLAEVKNTDKEGFWNE